MSNASRPRLSIRRDRKSKEFPPAERLCSLSSEVPVAKRGRCHTPPGVSWDVRRKVAARSQNKPLKSVVFIYFVLNYFCHLISFRSFQLRDLPGSQLHLLCQALCNPYCKIKDLKLFVSFLPESSEAVCKYLASVLICNPNLTELDLSKNPLGDTGVKYLCEGLRHSNCKVEKLDLSTCYLTDASCVELSSVLQVSQTLKELFVFTNALGDTRVQHLCEAWCPHPSRLSECSLSAARCESLMQILSSTQSLTRLLLINNKIEDLGLKLLCEGLKQPDRQLKDLALWTCNLTRECCQDLCNALYANEHLRDLDPSDNALGDEGMQVLCEGLKQPFCKLQTLCIDMDHLHEETFREIEALKVSKPGITW
ncbi:NACHT, LRR and PYD domains-containing protein 12 [Pteropus alecto]|uniref:NACHT, LRR and PYD domains-containing protein 12 n=1 Tax=Pteropus alecto TaxID=9402 RepID=L5KF52_PTEAL|nr:NACHT, LRR and PYD domains-containing protein 12 [Pteropus alecto]